MKNIVRVLVVEDEPLYRKGLCAQLSDCPGIEVVGAASNGEEAIELAERLDPDAVLMDIELGGATNGIQAGQAIKSASPVTGMVLLSSHNNRQYLALAEEAGGWSYLLKKNVLDVDTLVDAIEGSLWGKVVVDPQLMTGLTPRPGTPLSGLAEERIKVLELVAQGYSDAAIAVELQVADVGTVKEHLAAIYRGLDIPPNGDVDPKVKAVLAYLDQTRSF